MTTNHKPTINGTDNGIWRRIRLIPFSITIPQEKQDKALVTKLLQESSGILNWCLQGIKYWIDEGLSPPKAVKEATIEYREEMDVLESFIKDYCNKEEKYEVKSKQLYERYTEWTEVNNEKTLSSKMFSLKLKEEGYISYRKRDGVYWKGIEIKKFP